VLDETFRDEPGKTLSDLFRQTQSEMGQRSSGVAR
jgi:hypothetical protein